MANIKARVTLACTIENVALVPNTLISGEESLLKVAKQDGAIDTSKAAVAYCEKTLGAEAVHIEKHVEPETETAEEAQEGGGE